MSVKFVLFFLLGSLSPIDGGGETRYQLKNDLLANYDKSMKPSGQITVLVQITPQRLDLFAENEILSMLSINTYEWRDPRLQWDPSDHEGLEELTLDQDLVWIPDIAVMYAVQPSTQLHSMYKVKLSPNGRVHFQPTLSQKLFCEPNYDGWPYGLQNCTFKVASYHYSKKDILVKKAVDFQPPPRQVLMSQIQIVDTKMEDFLDSISEESYVKVSIIFKGVMHQNASSSSSTGAAGTSSSAATTSDIGKNIHTSQALILLIILLLLQPNIIIDFV